MKLITFRRNNNQAPCLKKFFYNWFYLYIFVGFTATVVASWVIYSYLARKSANDLILTQLNYAAQKIDTTQKNLQEITRRSNDIALIKARVFAMFVEITPAILNDDAKLAEIKKIIDVDELHVSDGNGTLVSSYPRYKAFVGYDMALKKQSRAFLPALTDRSFELVQEPQVNSTTGDIVQYAGVARRDQPGIVQIAYYPARIAEALKLADINGIAKGIHIGKTGYVTIVKDSDTSKMIAEGAVLLRDGQNDNGKKCTVQTISHRGFLITGYLPHDEIYVSRDSVLRILIIANLLFFVVVLQRLSSLLKKVVIHSINTINDALSRITEGKLDEQIEVSGPEEFQFLASGINAMVAALKTNSEEEKKRFVSELELASAIQKSVLPSNPPPQREFSLHACMDPANKVSGDFFDFFNLDEHRIALVVADVAGGGLTAALYMMNTKEAIKERLISGLPLEAAINAVNADFCERDQKQMFVTTFVAVIDMKKQTLCCINAGHNPQLIKHGQSPWKYMTLAPSVAIAVRKDAHYEAFESPFKPGDRLFLYTNGVVEMQNPRGVRFGSQRLLNAMNEGNYSPTGTIEYIRERIRVFADTEPQSDDITMLAFDFLTPPAENEPQTN